MDCIGVNLCESNGKAGLCIRSKNKIYNLMGIDLYRLSIYNVYRQPIYLYSKEGELWQ